MSVAPPNGSPGTVSLALQSVIGLMNAFLALMMYQPLFFANVATGYLGDYDKKALQAGGYHILEAFFAAKNEANPIHRARAVLALAIILIIFEVIAFCVSSVAWQLNLKFVHFAAAGLRGFEVVLVVVAYAIPIDYFIELYQAEYAMTGGQFNPWVIISLYMKKIVNAFVALAFHIIFLIAAIASSVVLAIQAGKNSGTVAGLPGAHGAPVGAAAPPPPGAPVGVAVPPAPGVPFGAAPPPAPGVPVAAAPPPAPGVPVAAAPPPPPGVGMAR